MMVPGCESSAGSSGVSRNRLREWRPTHAISTCRYHQASDGRSRSIEHTMFSYVFAGSGMFRDASVPRAILTEDVSCPDAEPVYEATNRSLVLFDAGDEVTVQAGDKGIRFLLISGRPLEEPAAWRGPIVMNTADELRQAYQELRDGTFLGG